MSFLYFFPDRGAPLSRNAFSEADKKYGLDCVLRNAPLACSGPPAKGPDGQTGVLVMIDRAEFGAANCVYEPAAQEWVKCSEHHWIGFWKERRPTPELLKREDAIDGEWIEIAGQRWLVPVCGPARVKLPTTFKLNGEIGGDGKRKWKPQVSRAYRHLMEQSERVYNELRSPPKGLELIEEANSRHYDFCADMMKVNYQLGNDEIDALELLTSDSVVEILRAAFGRITYERELELGKQEAATGTPG